MLNPDVEDSPDYGDSNKEDIDEETLGKTDEERNRTRTWEAFSNHAASKRSSVISIEAWHDSIHMLVGIGDGEVNGHAEIKILSLNFR